MLIVFIYYQAGGDRGHFHPIPSHLPSLLEEYVDEALPSLVQRLWRKLKDYRIVFRKNNGIQKATTSRRSISAASASGTNDEISALDKIRNDNIQRNNHFLHSLGLGSIIKDSKGKASKQCRKVNSRSDEESDDGCDENSEDDDDSDDVYSPVKAQDAKVQSTVVIDLSVDEKNEEEDEDLKPYLYLKGTMHYDSDEPDGTDQGVFRCEIITVEDFKDGAEIVVYRSKFNAATRKWEATNMDDPIRVADIVEYYKSRKNRKMMNSILNM